ncbi:monocarboxylate transporter 14-like [Babylonia areolata]|uniref:monocarboxylate transporter 14-like n=1 Tax=Babylonia areolata TaxID=304850 RepID=UPI003FD36A7E
MDKNKGVNMRDVDGGWAWVALVATILILTLQASYTTSVGLFLVEFLETFSGSKGFIALIGALAVSGQTILGPVAGILSNLLTHRVVIMIGGLTMTLGLVMASFAPDLISLLILFGIICGVGTGLTYSPAVTVISNYFNKYRTVANGVTLGSPGIGVLVTPYLLRWLIESYGWRFAMAAYGCFMAQTCVLASLLFPHQTCPTPLCCARQSKSQTPPTEKDQDVEALKAPLNGSAGRLKDLRNAEIKVMVGSRTAMHVSEFGSVLLSNSVVWEVEEVKNGMSRRLKHLLSRKLMWVMCLNQLLLMSGLAINTVLFPSYAHTIGITYADLPSLYTVYGVTMITSRVTGGFIFSLIPQHMLKVFFCLQVSVAMVLALLPLYGITLPALFVYKFLIGVTYGPTFLLVTPILIHYIGLEDLSVAFGVLMLCCGFGYITAPPLGGLMYDFFGSYRISYYIAGATVGAGALSLLLLLVIKDLQPMEEDGSRKQEALMTADDQKDSSDDNNDDDSNRASSHTKENGHADNIDDGDRTPSHGKENGHAEKPAVNGVHVIDDMDDLCKFIDHRPS